MRSIVTSFKEEALLVYVRDNNVEYALKTLKRRIQRSGLYKEMRLRRRHETPSEKKARKEAEKVKRIKKSLKKRMEREGY